jgi:hypothetical protein
VSERTAAFLFGLQLFLTVPLYLVLGWAADRFPKPPVLMCVVSANLLYGFGHVNL